MPAAFNSEYYFRFHSLNWVTNLKIYLSILFSPQLSVLVIIQVQTMCTR